MGENMSVDPTMFQFRTFAEACDLFNMTSNDLLHFYEIGAIDIAIKVDDTHSFNGKTFHSLTAKMTREQTFDLGCGHLSRYEMKGGAYELSGFWFLDDLINRECHMRNIKQIVSNSPQSIADFKDKVKEARFSGVVDKISSHFGYKSRITALRSADLSKCSPWKRKIRIDLPISTHELGAFILNKDLKVLQESKKNNVPPINLYQYPYKWGFTTYMNKKFRNPATIATIRAYQEGFYSNNVSSLELSERKTTPRLKALINLLAEHVDKRIYEQIKLESTSDYLLFVDLISQIPEIGPESLIQPYGAITKINDYLSSKGLPMSRLTNRTVADWIKEAKA